MEEKIINEEVNTIIPIQNRYNFEVYVEVENGNPNGDPDMGNSPRMDHETNIGIITDVKVKRLVRDYVNITRKEEKLGEDEQKNHIYVLSDDEALNSKNQKAVDYYNSKGVTASKKELGEFMCRNFYDVRTFGAVMSTSINCGTETGPVQIGFGTSIDPIYPQFLTISRCAVTKQEDKDEGKETTFGDKYIIPYALYRIKGSVSAFQASKTGFTEKDLNLLFEALQYMFEVGSSASRGRMATRKIIIFKHPSKLGNIPAHTLHESVKIERVNKDVPARCYNDYKITIDRSKISEHVEIREID